MFFERASKLTGIDGCWTASAESAEPVRTVVPADGCVDLIVRVRGDGVSASVERPTVRAFSSILRPASKEEEAGETLFGVRFQCGFGGPIEALFDGRRHELSRLLDLRPVSLRASPERTLERLEAFAATLPEALPPAFLLEFEGEIREGQGTVLPALRSEKAERALQRAAQRWFGFSPKTLQRIVRVQAASKALKRAASARSDVAVAILGRSLLAETAAEFGYADQAHLTRECRELLGRTPRELFKGFAHGP